MLSSGQRPAHATCDSAPTLTNCYNRPLITCAGIAVIHTGADLLTRACYMPDTWGLRVRVCGPGGEPKEPAAAAGEQAQQAQTAGQQEQEEGGSGSSDGLVVQDIAGPLCFQGAMQARAAAAAAPRTCAGTPARAHNNSPHTPLLPTAQATAWPRPRACRAARRATG